MKSNTPAVRVVNLMKSFKIPIESSNGIKQKIINTLKGKKGYRVFTPLNDVSFTIEKGDFFGIDVRALKNHIRVATFLVGKLHSAEVG
jgi:hypothetical protein